MLYLLIQIIQLLSACFHYKILTYLFFVKKKRFFKAFLFFISYLISNMVIFIHDWNNLPPTFLVYIVGTLYFCEGNTARKLTLSSMLASIVFTWNIIADNLIWNISGSFFYADLSTLLFMVILYLIILKWGPDRKTDLENSLWHLLLLLTLIPLGIVFSIVLLSNTYRFEMLHMTLLFFTLLSFIGLLWAIAVLAKQQQLELQNLYREMNQKYYEIMEHQHFEIRRLKHDLANHLQAISVLPDQEKDSYISNLLGSPALTQRTDYCGDSTINAVLSVKEEKMKENQISLHTKLDILSELPFKKTDICAVFANALDNAIESCKKFEAEKRSIELTASSRKGLFVLSIKNPSDLILKENNLPLTSKADSYLHGYGLRSIQEIVNRYHGHMDISAGNGFFELFLYIPDKK